MHFLIYIINNIFLIDDSYTLCFFPVFDRSDMFANKRPLMALCDGARYVHNFYIIEQNNYT